jgi:hypothetical protein
MKKKISFILSLLILTNFSLQAIETHENNHSHEFHEQNKSSSIQPGISLNKTQEERIIEYFKKSGSVIFTPPLGWSFADPKQLPKSVKIMVVGKGEYDYPPSINLGTENFKGTLKDYLKIVKSLNDAQGSEWKDLGKIRTAAGNASLSQVDMMTEWGKVRMMHVILVKSNMAYILTAASRKEEFSKFYKDFFASMRSLRINLEHKG